MSLSFPHHLQPYYEHEVRQGVPIDDSNALFQAYFVLNYAKAIVQAAC